MTRSHRNEDRGGEHRWTFNGVEYPTRKLMCEARRAEYVRLLDEEGMNFTQAAHAVGVSKRTGKAWRNGRTRATGRNEKPLVDWYRSTMDKPKTLHPRYLSQEERIQIADRLRLGDSIRAIARLLGRDPGTVSREVERNRNPESGGYEPYRAQQKAADRLKRPKPRKAAEGTRLWDEIAAGLRRHWSPEQIANRLRLDFPDNGDMHASVETIYQAIYLQARGELKQELKRAMRQGRTARYYGYFSDGMGFQVGSCISLRESHQPLAICTKPVLRCSRSTITRRMTSLAAVSTVPSPNTSGRKSP